MGEDENDHTPLQNQISKNMNLSASVFLYRIVKVSEFVFNVPPTGLSSRRNLTHNSMIFYDQQCNFHDYLMHGLQPPLLAASSPH